MINTLIAIANKAYCDICATWDSQDARQKLDMIISVIDLKKNYDIISDYAFIKTHETYPSHVYTAVIEPENKYSTDEDETLNSSDENLYTLEKMKELLAKIKLEQQEALNKKYESKTDN